MNIRKQSADMHRQLIKVIFGKKYVEWSGKHNDDRYFYCNLYEILMEALDAMESIDNTFIWVAFADSFNAECEKMREIQERFQKREE